MKKGISLITLVITIVVIIILAAAVILTLGNNNPIESARRAAFLQNFSNLNDEYALFCSSMMLKNYDFLKENLGIKDGKIMYNGEELDGGKTLHDILPSLKGSSLDGKITIKAGELALDSNLLNEAEKDTAIENNLNMKGISIKSRADLEKIGNDDAYPLDGIYDIDSDIDMGGEDSGSFVAIGKAKGVAFTGVLDGNNYHINNVYINSSDDRNALVYTNNGVIKNIVVSSGEITGGVDTNAIATWNYGMIDNCIVNKEVNIKGTARVSGIVGLSSGTVQNCKNYSNVTGSLLDIGGIVGKSDNATSQIKNCENHGNINGPSGTAGICGTAQYGITIENCKNYGNISNDVNAKNTGGIVGQVYNLQGRTATIKQCYNGGNVSGYTMIGGIVGTALRPSDNPNKDNIGSIDIEQCINNSEISGRIIDSSTYDSTSSFGGIIGFSSVGVKIDSCANRGNVVSNLSGVLGGIAGRIGVWIDSSIENSYNTGEINGKTQIGGIAGSLLPTSLNANINIKNSYSAGQILGTSATGNMVGYKDSAVQLKFENAYYNSDISNSKAINGSEAEGVIGKTTDEMLSRDFVTLLLNKFSKDVGEINYGYPILSFE